MEKKMTNKKDITSVELMDNMPTGTHMVIIVFLLFVGIDDHPVCACGHVVHQLYAGDFFCINHF